MIRWVRADRADLYVLVFIAAASIVLAIQPLSWLVTGMVIDDALYYPKIALSVADGSGFTYDGQTETNGIHPLWQIVWLPLALIADGDANLLLRLGFLLSATIMAVGFFVLSRVLRRVGVGPVISAFILAGLFFARADLFMSLMESVLVFLMVGLALIVSLRAPETSRELLRQRVILGIALGAMCLSRLDTVFIVPGLAIATAYAWGAKSPRTWLLHQVTTGAAFMAVVVPYLLWNVIRFGNLLSRVRDQENANVGHDAGFDIRSKRVVRLARSNHRKAARPRCRLVDHRRCRSRADRPGACSDLPAVGGFDPEPGAIRSDPRGIYRGGRDPVRLLGRNAAWRGRSVVSRTGLRPV